jgi:hypothetical protein
MLLAASVLADCAPDDIQQRALARYTFLYGDAFLGWARRWRNNLKRVPSTSRRAAALKPELSALSTVLDSAGGVRDYLAAKRQAAGDMRADDIEATSLLWSAVNPHTVSTICASAIRLYDGLNQSASTSDSIVSQLVFSNYQRARVRASLPGRDPAFWHIAADTAADLRPYTLPAAQGGNLGRLIAQVNDVAVHLDVLLRIAPVVAGTLPYDWLIRSGMVVELNALLDLTVGAPPGQKINVAFPLLELCERGRAQAAAVELQRLRGSLGREGWEYTRWMRNTIGAHLDDGLTMLQVHEHLASLDYQGIIRLAEHVLDWLDALGATQLDLQLLLLSERPIKSWPTDAAKPGPGTPNPSAVPGSLARLFRTINSPYISATASTMGSAVLAGVLSRRQPKPRARGVVPPRWDPLLHPRLPASLKQFG